MIFVILDWKAGSLVVHPEDGTVMIWASEQEALRYAESAMQKGLWEVLKVPRVAMIHLF